MKPAATILFLALAALCSAAEPPGAPWIDRLEPFGAAQGETVEVRIVGKRLEAVTAVDLGAAGLTWLETLSAEPEAVTGRVRVDAAAGLGAHTLDLRAPNGRSNGRLFYVDALPSSAETEPNDSLETAQAIRLEPQVLHGALLKLSDRDFYRFEARAGERWVFDVRSIEYGGFLESEISLLDGEGRRIAFSDDRDDYLETPRLEHVFESGGVHHLLVDQYRGPQGVSCSANCGYMLRISRMPIVEAAHPLGARRGSTVQVSLRGRALSGIESAWLVPARNAEHYRLTFPYSIPVLAGPEPKPAERVSGKILRVSDAEALVEFQIPPTAPTGLWRLWAASPAGPVEGLSFVIDDLEELSEAQARKQGLHAKPLTVNGSLDLPDEEDVYRFRARRGEPLRFYVLAVQLGLPYIDPLLEIVNAEGAVLAEHDDLMSGQGTVIGNPDSSLYWTPEEDGEFKLRVRDRIGRGGPSYVYRLVVDSAKPGFSLITDAENPLVVRGGESRIGVLLIRDPGFEQAVDIWAEDAPAGIKISGGRFRADQPFGPSGDGDNVIIPEVFLDVAAEPTIPLGDHNLRIFGRSEDGRVVRAFATLWIGPPSKRNDVRRPRPAITLTAVEPQALALGEPVGEQGQP